MRKSPIKHIPICLLFLLISLSAYANEPEAGTAPNIIVYMIDDLGWNHIGVEPGTMGTAKSIYHTPHLAELAKKGMSFTQAYAQPNCAPTRAAMLTGQYPARINNDVYVVGNLNRYGGKEFTKQNSTFKGPPQSEDVAPAAITVAEALKKNGYATAHIGKYHVGGRAENTLPEHVGFDINIGGYSQGHQSTCFASKHGDAWKFKGLGRGDFDRYSAPYTKAYVERYHLPESLIGTPKHVSDALGDAVEETISRFAKGDKPFYLQFHAYAVHGPVRARPDLKAGALKRNKELTKGTLEYVAFISSVDENLKRLLATVDDPNGDGNPADSLTDNTLILFTSDNGGTHADNLPLRGKKGMLTEGGIRVPLIAYWPGVIPAGTVTDHLVHAIDYYPTYLELAGNRWTPDASEHPLDGESFAHVLRKPDAKPARGPLYFLFPGYMDTRAQPTVVAIDEIQGKRYKLFYYYEADAWELYCLNDDMGEANNIITSMPERAAGLSKKMRAWLQQQHPTWQPKYPIDKRTGKPAGPPKSL